VDKVVEYRAFARMRRAFPQAYTTYEMGNFSRFLIKVSVNDRALACIHEHALESAWLVFGSIHSSTKSA